MTTAPLFTGPAIVLPDHVDSEQLHPARYFSLDEERVRSGLFEGMAKEIKERLRPDSIVVAGRNFGCGSSREVVVRALLLNGIHVIVADSFARIFYRNAVNLGLTVVECPGCAAQASDGDLLEVDIRAGFVKNKTRGNARCVQAPSHRVFARWHHCAHRQQPWRRRRLR
jgi:3-isopropylmalate/(R)-2-methylmalate dehydratase small subunit